ncbi:MAG: hypothetical protein GY803_21820 [Chloroflexi bacterium]|nr:hypothetical protein [Chloroflexota bacterium]
MKTHKLVLFFLILSMFLVACGGDAAVEEPAAEEPAEAAAIAPRLR